MTFKTPLLKAVGAVLTHIWAPSFARGVARAALELSFEDEIKGIQVIDFNDIVTQQEEVRLLLGNREFRDTPLMDILALTALIRSVSARRLFEIGTFTGLGTLHLLLNASEGGHVWTLDLSPEDRARFDGDPDDKAVNDNIVGRHFRATPHVKRITQILSDSRTFDPGSLKGTMDLVFVDGCHDYDFVVNDSTKALELVRDGGLVVWHDVSRGFPGVRKHLLELSKKVEVKWVRGTQIAFTAGHRK